jgi:hypothetical protein
MFHSITLCWKFAQQEMNSLHIFFFNLPDIAQIVKGIKEVFEVGQMIIMF